MPPIELPTRDVLAFDPFGVGFHWRRQLAISSVALHPPLAGGMCVA
ncbi:MAG: hypothetical protein ACRC46_01835 [Thermoguttaceae bacterium]